MGWAPLDSISLIWKRQSREFFEYFRAYLFFCFLNKRMNRVGLACERGNGVYMAEQVVRHAFALFTGRLIGCNRQIVVDLPRQYNRRN